MLLVHGELNVLVKGPSDTGEASVTIVNEGRGPAMNTRGTIVGLP